MQSCILEGSSGKFLRFEKTCCHRTSRKKIPADLDSMRYDNNNNDNNNNDNIIYFKLATVVAVVLIKANYVQK